MKLSTEQKLEALAARFYQGLVWEPKPGDLYTTSRADLEVYRVVSVENDIVVTEYTENGAAPSEWPLSEFTTDGFGPKRVWIPPHILPAQYEGEEEGDLIAECQALDEHDNDRV